MVSAPPIIVQAPCPVCQGTETIFNNAGGDTICATCGNVLEENAMVNELTFGETSSGAAIANGTFVPQGSSESFHHHKY